MAEDKPRIFSGVNFVLYGFNLTTQEKVRHALVEAGGVDVGRYGPDCTHLIVDKILYDDPICQAARSDGTTVVTKLWVEHSFDTGMPVDPNSVIYMPLRDLNGIPGAKSLVICLTGYLRQDRDDIMTMVGLMGATFSKPLVANKITHLICYKFEGDKYELAKKLKIIKLVNHRWLEDCLRAWKLLPEAEYDKSGYELELLEAQAKDSEDEDENMDKLLPIDRDIVVTPQSSRFQSRSPAQLFTLKERASTNVFDSSIPTGLGNFGASPSVTNVNANSMQPQKVHSNCTDLSGPMESGSGRKICNSASKLYNKSPVNELIGKNKNSPAPSSPMFQSVTKSRQSPQKFCHSLERRQPESNFESHLEVDMGKNCIVDEFGLSSMEAEGEVTLVTDRNDPLIKAGSPPGKQHSVSSLKRNLADSCGGFELVERSVSPGLIPKTDVSQAKSLVGGQPIVTHFKFTNFASPENALKTSSATSARINVGDKMLRAVDGLRLPEGSFTNAMKPKHGSQAEDVFSPEDKGAVVKDLDAKPDIDLVTEADNSGSKPKRRKMLAKKTLGSRPSLGRGKALNTKGPIYMAEKDSAINNAWAPVANMDVGNSEDFGKFDNVAEATSTSVVGTDINTDVEKVSISRNEAPLEMVGDDETESPENNEKSEPENTVLKGNSGGAVNKSGSDNTADPIDRSCPNVKGHLIISTPLGKKSTLMDSSDDMKTPSHGKYSIERRKMDFTPAMKSAISGEVGTGKQSKRKIDTGETETKYRTRVSLAERGRELDSSEKTSEQKNSMHLNLEEQVMASADKEIAFEAGSVASGNIMEPKYLLSAEANNRKRLSLAERHNKKLDSSEKKREQNDNRCSLLEDQALTSSDKEIVTDPGSVAASGNNMELNDSLFAQTRSRKRASAAKRDTKLGSEKTSEQNADIHSNLVEQVVPSAGEETVTEAGLVASASIMELKNSSSSEMKSRKKVTVAKRGKKLDSKKTIENNDNRLEDQVMAPADVEIVTETGTVASASKSELKDSTSSEVNTGKNVTVAKRGKKLDSKKTSKKNDNRLEDQVMVSADVEIVTETKTVASASKSELKDSTSSEMKTRKNVTVAKRGKKLDSKKTSERNGNRLEDQVMPSADEEIVTEAGPVSSSSIMEPKNSTSPEMKNRKKIAVAKRGKKLDSKKTSERNGNRLEDHVMVSADVEIVTETGTIASGSKIELKDSTSAETKNGKKVTVAKRGKKLDSKDTSKKNYNMRSNLVDQLMASDDEETVIEDGPVALGNKMKLEVSTFADNAVEEKIISEEKCTDVSKVSNDLPMQETASITAAPKKALTLETSGAKKETKNTKRSQLAKRDKKAADFGQSSLEGEKENMPGSVGGQCIIPNEQQLQKMTPNSSEKSTKSVTGDLTVVSSPSIPNSNIGDHSVVTVASSALVHNRVPEPAWFILSGHSFQRKEFQKVIKHLKGRLCRDVHKWSYQATHFIVPDLVRRTEKFFAAAASGRWILKSDYLTASNEAGKFLPEEPFEWYKNGLSEDGAINLVAPRKWRTLRERTGHGAFFGMRVIIYGECIAPPLETLKRVIKSGDGTILATSPPYHRSLESGVDYAIVSPGMPRVDMWVQEFLRHEVPCIVTDYLVDFVCKPGYSLDKHVQYNTQAWAEKSFKKMVESMENIADDWGTGEVSNSNDNDNNDGDIACDVCGSCERGNVMLICGDENGTSGCGVGTHIDCCDPPLAEVPEEDWFCTKCSSSSNSISKSKNTRKGKTKKKARKGT